MPSLDDGVVAAGPEIVPETCGVAKLIDMINDDGVAVPLGYAIVALPVGMLVSGTSPADTTVLPVATPMVLNPCVRP